MLMGDNRFILTNKHKTIQYTYCNKYWLVTLQHAEEQLYYYHGVLQGWVSHNTTGSNNNCPVYDISSM